MLAFEETGAYRLLLPAMSENPDELERFYAETVEPLVAYDEQYETELVRHARDLPRLRRQRRPDRAAALHPPPHDPLPARARARADRPRRRLHATGARSSRSASRRCACSASRRRAARPPSPAPRAAACPATALTDGLAPALCRPLRADRAQPVRAAGRAAHRRSRSPTTRRARRDIEALLGVPPRLLRDGEGWASEEFTPLRHAQLDPRRRALALQLDDRRRAGADDRRAAARVVPRARAWCSTSPAEGRRRRDTARRLEAELARIGHDLQPRDIVLVRTGRDEFYAQPDYMARGPGVTAEATRWLFDRGVRVMGIDAWGWDAPLHLQAAGGARARRARHLLGRPPGRPALLADRAPVQPRRAAAGRLHRLLLPAEDRRRQRRPGPGGGDPAGLTPRRSCDARGDRHRLRHARASRLRGRSAPGARDARGRRSCTAGACRRRRASRSRATARDTPGSK